MEHKLTSKVKTIHLVCHLNFSTKTLTQNLEINIKLILVVIDSEHQFSPEKFTPMFETFFANYF